MSAALIAAIIQGALQLAATGWQMYEEHVAGGGQPMDDATRDALHAQTQAIHDKAAAFKPGGA